MQGICIYGLRRIWPRVKCYRSEDITAFKIEDSVEDLSIENLKFGSPIELFLRIEFYANFGTDMLILFSVTGMFFILCD